MTAAGAFVAATLGAAFNVAIWVLLGRFFPGAPRPDPLGVALGSGVLAFFTAFAHAIASTAERIVSNAEHLK